MSAISNTSIWHHLNFAWTFLFFAKGKVKVTTSISRNMYTQHSSHLHPGTQLPHPSLRKYRNQKKKNEETKKRREFQSHRNPSSPSRVQYRRSAVGGRVDRAFAEQIFEWSSRRKVECTCYARTILVQRLSRKCRRQACKGGGLGSKGEWRGFEGSEAEATAAEAKRILKRLVKL